MWVTVKGYLLCLNLLKHLRVSKNGQKRYRNVKNGHKRTWTIIDGEKRKDNGEP